MEAWHTMTPGQACAALKSDLTQGLSPGEVKLRLEEQGPNELNKTPRTPLLRRLWEQLKDPMILVLLAAAAVSYLASRGEDWLDTVIILLIVLVNAVISLIQESNAERALEALQAMAAPQARVIRAGGHQKIAAAGLVPGDIIQLEAGDYVPADARLIEAAGLRVDESAITG